MATFAQKIKRAYRKAQTSYDSYKERRAQRMERSNQFLETKLKQERLKAQISEAKSRAYRASSKRPAFGSAFFQGGGFGGSGLGSGSYNPFETSPARSSRPAKKKKSSKIIVIRS